MGFLSRFAGGLGCMILVLMLWAMYISAERSRQAAAAAAGTTKPVVSSGPFPTSRPTAAARTSRPTPFPTPAPPTLSPTPAPPTLPPTPAPTLDLSNELNWFDGDAAGLPGFTLDSLWGHALFHIDDSSAIARTPFQRQHPQLALVKPPLLGGNLLALSLERIIHAYRVALPPNNNDECTGDSSFSLSLRRGARRDWAEQCVPHARFVTVLSEPIAQTLAWEALKVNFDYYANYPAKQCVVEPKKKTTTRTTATSAPSLSFDMLHPEQDLWSELANKTTSCVNTPLRRNLTMQLVAHSVTTWLSSSKSAYGEAVTLDWQWILGNPKTARQLPRLSTNALRASVTGGFFFAGVESRLDEFWTLLTTHLGWDSDLVSYTAQCKSVDVSFSNDEFREAFPQVYSQLEQRLSKFSVVYAAVEHDFDVHFAALRATSKAVGSALVRTRSSAILQEKQAAQSLKKTKSLPWRQRLFADGHTELC